MVSSRRNYLRLCATLSGIALAGCSTQDDSISYPDDESTRTPDVTTKPTTSSTAETATEESTPTESEPEPTPGPTKYPGLATDAELIVDEIAWFATDYEASIRAYRNAIGRLLATISQIHDASEITGNDIDRLESATSNVSTVALNEIASHFDVHDKVLNPNNSYVRTTRKFAERGDWDRANEELAAMHDFYEMRQRTYVIDEELSNEPVQGTLLRTLQADKISDKLRKRHRVATDFDPRFFELYHPRTGYTSFAYSEQSTVVYGEPIDHRDRNAFRQFEEVDDEIERTDRAYVVVDLVPDDNPKQWTYEHANEFIYLQQYDSEIAAKRAVDRLLRAAVSQERTQELGGRRWRRIYYYHDGDITYAYLLQAGRTLIAAAPSTTAWEEREEHWEDLLALSFIWNAE